MTDSKIPAPAPSERCAICGEPKAALRHSPYPVPAKSYHPFAPAPSVADKKSTLGNVTSNAEAYRDGTFTAPAYERGDPAVPPQHDCGNHSHGHPLHLCKPKMEPPAPAPSCPNPDGPCGCLEAHEPTDFAPAPGTLMRVCAVCDQPFARIGFGNCHGEDDDCIAALREHLTNGILREVDLRAEVENAAEQHESNVRMVAALTRQANEWETRADKAEAEVERLTKQWNDVAELLEICGEQRKAEKARADAASEHLRVAREALAEAMRPHLWNDDDNWWSCPLAVGSDGERVCCNDALMDDPKCNCGADAANAKIASALERTKP